MTLRLIAAIAKDGGIGKNGELLFSIRRDMEHFKALTMGKTVIMGRETLDSLPHGSPLPRRRNLVLTRNRSFFREGVEVFHEVDALLAALADGEEAWVMGGAEIYRLLLPLCDTLELTEVDETRDADRYFPPFHDQFVPTEVSPWMEENGVRFRFCRYEREQALTPNHQSLQTKRGAKL